MEGIKMGKVVDMLEGKLKWYETAIYYNEKGIVPPAGFTSPKGNSNSWKSTANELETLIKLGRGA